MSASPIFIVTGTDTDIGKTIFASALVGALNAHYWKPVQSGIDAATESDSATVARLSGVKASQILPEAYRLTTPCSPHLSAEIDGVMIDTARLTPPMVHGPLIIEAAGGVMVPLTRDTLYADQFVTWGLPAILVARTSLGTINHSLLSIEALKRRGINIHGIAFVGDANEDNEALITNFTGVKRLGRLPLIAPLNHATLASAFQAHFRLEDFTA
ncbi:dethiobiotin synthase [Aquisediminimonas sediminicola]|uniref:dethiobiotin synthase n=1 Tax=Alteraquisediminimonas sediminicola TaxID=2676787 RepID=UPI001C8E1AEE|nr:dethiobiotin synthase [Aquisediminimonas sediminicola]